MNEYDALINQGGLSLERLATLCRVADAGGLSKAAGGDTSRLSLYSRQLKDLESFFGTALTRKVGRTVVLTEEAHALAAKVRGQFRELTAFREETGKAAPVITIGASHSIYEWWLWPRLSQLKETLLMGTRLKLLLMRSVDIARALDENVLDAALVRADAISSCIRSVPAFEMRYSLFVPHALKPKRKITAEVMANLPLALSPGGQIRERLEVGATNAGVALHIVLECPSFALAAKAVKTGQYAAILPDFAETSFCGHPVTKFAIPFDGLPPRKLVLAWNPRVPEFRITPLRLLIKHHPSVT